MSDLISREELLEKLEEHIEYKEFDYCQEEPLINMSFEQLEDIICSQPTVDAKSVVHGKWKYSRKEDIATCKNCSYEHYLGTYHQYATNFCPECGADMQKKGE